MWTANALQLEAGRRRAVLIRFHTSLVASLKSLSLSVAVLEHIYCFYVTLRCDLELWPRDLDRWPWTCVVDLLRHSETLYEIWAKSDNPRRSYCSLNIWPYDLEHESRAPLCCGIVCKKFKLSEATRSWNATIFWCDTLWPRPLTPWPWKFVVGLRSRGHSLWSNNPRLSYS